MRSLLSAVIGMTFFAAGAAIAADGEAVYNASCAACHKILKPKFGDKSAWEPLIKQGEDALATSVIKGKGAMPARGGKPGLSDDDIKAAVGYMVNAVK
jgi:cytochrome c5